jgi:hypothetical protein
MGVRDSLRAAGLGAAVLAANSLAAFLWVWFYAVAVAPGHEGGFYQAYAQRVAPLSAVVIGAPMMALAGRWIAQRQRANIAPAVPALGYVTLDLTLRLGSGVGPSLPLMLVIWAVLAAAAWSGGWLVRRRLNPQ